MNEEKKQDIDALQGTEPSTEKKEKPKKQKKARKKWKLWTKILVGIIIAAVICVAGLYGYVYSRKMSLYRSYEVTEEKLQEIAPENMAQSEKLAAMPGYGAEDTWAFYIYVVGSNLESLEMDELSLVSNYLSDGQRAANEKEGLAERTKNMVTFIEEVESQGGELPKRLYNPVDKSSITVEEEKTPTDTTLPGFATYNIRQMLDANMGDNIQVILQTGGAKRWEDIRINPNRSQRFLLDQNGMQEIYNSRLVNMADKETLADFLKYCRKNYPADHEVVIFWNHGGGITGYGLDEIYNDMMSNREIEAAFLEAVGRPDKEKPPFEAIGYDACLMASAEVADTLAGFAKYLYASEEVEPGYGWNYTAILNAFSENPSINGAQLGKVIADSFIKQAVSSVSDMGIVPAVTFSVTDLSKASEVYDAYGRFAENALKEVLKDPAVLSEISRAASASVSYADIQYELYNTIDLGVFMENLPEKFSKEGAEVLKKIDDSVLYARNTLFMEGSKGLSIYYPQHVTTVGIARIFLPYIHDLSKNQDINALYYYKIAGCLNEEYQEYVKSKGYAKPKVIDYSIMENVSALPVLCSGDGNLELTLNEELFSLTQNVTFGIAKFDEDSGIIDYYGEDVYASLSDNGKISTFFDGKWISYGGYPLTLEVISSTPESALFKSKILYNTENAFMLIGYDAVNEEISLLGIAREMNEATLERNLMQPKTGDIIMPVRQQGNLYNNTYIEKTETVVVGKNTKLEEIPLKDGAYLEYLNVMDLRSDEYISTPVTFTMSGGKIKDQIVDDSFIAYDRD